MSKENSENTSQKSDQSFHNQKGMGRRDFLQTAFGFTAAGLLGLPSIVNTGAASFLEPTNKSLKYPFKLGVASGDPLPHGVVLWTRLVPEPLQKEGGMPKKPINVKWEVSSDLSFNQIIKQGTAVAKPQYAHSLHIEVDGLEPNRWYYYRFKAENEVSPIGRTRTLPAYDSNIDELNFAFASCQKFFAGYYTAYNHLVNENIDLVFFLGDYIYEYAGQEIPGRTHVPDKEIYSLDEYRIRYGQYKSDPSLQSAHAAFPWIVTLDDHEIDNNWAGKGPPYEDNDDFLARREVAFQAFYEHMPLRKESLPEDIYIDIYRSFTYGNLAKFMVLDTRQYRTNFACGTSDDISPCDEAYDTSRTMLGEKQEEWLFDNLKSSTSSWNILPQQVRMLQFDQKEGPGKILDMDKWDGYIATRDRLFNVITQNNISNFVVLTGDMHRNMANNLLEDFDNPDSSVIGSELVGTSISSNGDGKDMTEAGRSAMKLNPHIKFFNAQRGYVRCKVTPRQMRADYRVVPYVSKPGAPIKTRASFKIKNGQPGLEPI